MSERSRTQDILVDILGVQNTINGYLNSINTALGEGGALSGLDGINTPFRHGDRVIYVDCSAPGPTHDGTTKDTAWLTIQDGLDDAATTNNTDLILIFADPGGDGYDINGNDEDSTWSHNDVIIVGIGRDQVRIINTFEGADHILGFESSHVYIKNLTFWTGSEDVERVYLKLNTHCDGSEIYNCDFYTLNAHKGTIGVFLEAERCRIERCHFYIQDDEEDPVNRTYGVVLYGANRNEIIDCIFDGAHPSVPGGIGIFAEDNSRQNVFKNNVFIENAIAIDLDQTTVNNFSVRSNYAGCIEDFGDDSGENYEVCPCTTAVI